MGVSFDERTWDGTRAVGAVLLNYVIVTLRAVDVKVEKGWAKAGWAAGQGIGPRAPLGSGKNTHAYADRFAKNE